MDTHLLLETYLHQLRLPGFVQQYRRIADDAAHQQLSYDRFLLALAEYEIQRRDQQRQTQLIRNARVPVLKDLADFDFTSVPTLNKALVLELAQGHYIARAEPILLIGNPGLGKTHIATGLALAACRRGYRVRFYTTAGLMNELLQAQTDHRLARVQAQALKQQVIVIDEFGFIPCTTLGAQLLFQFCAALHERVAVILTSNLRFADWPQVLGDERLAGALIDRLTHRGHILEFMGESYRFRQRMQRVQERRARGTTAADAPAPSADPARDAPAAA